MTLKDSKKETYIEPKMTTYLKEELEKSVTPHGGINQYTDHAVD